MDIGKLDMNEAGAGAEMDVLHPGTGEKTGLVLMLRVYDSDEVEAAGREVDRASLAKKDKVDLSKHLMDKRIAKAQAALVDVKGGTGASKDVSGVRGMIANQPGFQWLLEQIEEFAGDRASFFKSAGGS